MSIANVEGVVTLDNGEKVNFVITSEGVQRWGNTVRWLGETVEPTETMWAVLDEDGYFAVDDEDEHGN